MFILSEKVSGRRTRNRRFERSRVTLGSDLICQIWIPDSGAAGVHAEITESEGRLRLRVMDKAPPVQVNDTLRCKHVQGFCYDFAGKQSGNRCEFPR